MSTRLNRSCQLTRAGRCIAFLSLTLVRWLSAHGAGEPGPLTIEAAIETTRAMTDRSGRAVFASSDNQRYAVLLIRGDVANDGVWAELRVGKLLSLDAADPKVVARFFTRGLGRNYGQPPDAYRITWPTTNAPFWIDERHVALVWSDERGTEQLFGIHVETGTLTQLTAQRGHVRVAAVSPRGQLLFATVIPCEPNNTSERRRRGQVIEAADVFELLFGCSALNASNSVWFLSDAETGGRQIAFHRGDAISYFPSRLAVPVFSREGNFALVSNTLTSVDTPLDWSRYTQPHFRNILSEREWNPHGGYARQLQQLFVVDMRAAYARPLWNVPMNVWYVAHAAWSPSGRSVLVGPTFLPVEQADEAGLVGEAVAEIDVRTGAWRSLPVPRDVATNMREIRWLDENNVEIAASSTSHLFARSAQGWKFASTRNASNDAKRGPRIRVELRQDLNTPPVLYAVDTRTGRERLLLDLNPELTSKYALGRVEWLDREVPGGRWEGRLYYPSRYEVGKRYPLVVHTHTLAGKHEFSLYSKGGAQPALGPGGSVYIAQTLAGHGFFVLHGRFVDQNPSASLLVRTQRELAALEHVIDRLVAESKVERSRVGIMGHSASGWLASYALAHSDFPYAAAITDDNKDGSYLQAALAAWDMGLGAEMIGAQPFGEGLCQWLRWSPALNAERIRTPLLMTVTSPGLEIGAWDMFSRLRHLRKPVELYLIPDIEIGMHGLQNPRQIRALQQRALDWWRFWLKDELDMDSEKARQYANWSRLRLLRDQDREQWQQSAAARVPCT